MTIKVRDISDNARKDILDHLIALDDDDFKNLIKAAKKMHRARKVLVEGGLI